MYNHLHQMYINKSSTNFNYNYNFTRISSILYKCTMPSGVELTRHLETNNSPLSIIIHRVKRNLMNTMRKCEVIYIL